MHELSNFCKDPEFALIVKIGERTPVSIDRPVEYHKVNAELIFAAIHAKRFDSESDIQVQVRAWIFHFDCCFDSD